MNDNDSDKIDQKLTGSMMYLVNTRLDSCYAVNVLKSFHESVETDLLDSSKTCIEISTRHS